MKQRGITESQVIEVLRKPSKMGLPTQPGRKRFRGAESSRRSIDVVFMERGEVIVVVTAIDVRRN